MRILCVFILLMSLSCNRFCYTSGPKKKELEQNPPGTVHFKGNLYVDQTEIANVHWREFVFWTLYFDSSKYNKVLPDTTVWLDMAEKDSGLASKLFYLFPDTYFRHPGYNNYAAVGISYEQAVAFCEWRMMLVNKSLSKEGGKKFKKVLYRLPTSEEWEMIAYDGLDPKSYPYGVKNLNAKRGGLLIYCATQSAKSDSKVINTHSYCPNSKGIYNISGNLSEMVAEKGMAKAEIGHSHSIVARSGLPIPILIRKPGLAFVAFARLLNNTSR